jgi:hypothetical protein
MAAITTTLLIASAAATVIGAGVSAYGQVQSGKTQAAVAAANAKEQERQAANTLRTLQAQSRMQEAQAEINFKMRKAEADARTSNADQLAAQAQQQDAINRANLRKRRGDFARQQAEQRTAIAASGVVEASGTPLDLLAETAAAIQQDANEQQFTAEQQRRTIFREADLERLGGELALQGATLDRNTGLTAARLTALQGQAESNSLRRQAEITRLTGKAAKQAGYIGAAGTIFSGLGSAAGLGVQAGVFNKPVKSS